MMDDKQWEEINNEQFDCMRDYLNDIQDLLKKYSGKETFEYIKPLRGMICEAYMQLFDERMKRVQDGDDLLKEIM